MKKVLRSCILVCAVLVESYATADPPPCDPAPVVKDVTVHRREITVSIVGLPRPSVPAAGASVESCVRYWTRGIDREIFKKPDLIVLPESVDCWQGMSRAQVRDWVVHIRGDGLLKAFQAYAKKHRSYLVFNSYRQRSDGRFANSTFALDRDGDVVAVYDKAYPTKWEIECPHLTIVPGERPVAVDTDFGRLSFVTCFDLNFRDLMEAVASLKPDVVAFCSAYHGGFWQRAWALTCRSYFVGSTLGEKAKNVWGPSGEPIFLLDDYFKTGSVRINTNCEVCHLDYNWDALRRAEAKYGPRMTVRDPGSVGCVTLLSNDPALKAETLLKEFGIEPLDDYYARSVRLRGGEIPRCASPVH